MKTRVKICGLRDPVMAQQAVEQGADYIGILCYQGSKRYVTPELGREIAKATLKAGGIPVAVFVDADAEHMLSICKKMGVDTVQLAGGVARQSHHVLPESIHRIYVLHVDAKGNVQPDVDEGIKQLDFKRDYVMFDGVVSGSGNTFDYQFFKNPYPMRFFLAGGLRPDNVADAIQKVHPDVVDVSSGVERAPGVKDISKITAFINAVQRINL